MSSHPHMSYEETAALPDYKAVALLPFSDNAFGIWELSLNLRLSSVGRPSMSFKSNYSSHPSFVVQIAIFFSNQKKDTHPTRRI